MPESLPPSPVPSLSSPYPPFSPFSPSPQFKNLDYPSPFSTPHSFHPYTPPSTPPLFSHPPSSPSPSLYPNPSSPLSTSSPIAYVDPTLLYNSPCTTYASAPFSSPPPENPEFTAHEAANKESRRDSGDFIKKERITPTRGKVSLKKVRPTKIRKVRKSNPFQQGARRSPKQVSFSNLFLFIPFIFLNKISTISPPLFPPLFFKRIRMTGKGGYAVFRQQWRGRKEDRRK